MGDTITHPHQPLEQVELAVDFPWPTECLDDCLLQINSEPPRGYYYAAPGTHAALEWKRGLGQILDGLLWSRLQTLLTLSGTRSAGSDMPTEHITHLM